MLRQALCLGRAEEMEAHDDHQLEDQVPALVNGTSSSSSRVVSQEMCCYCFDVLLAHLTHSPPPRTAHFPNDEYPLFVTWKMGKERRLRGCMGTFTARKLHKGLAEYSITSAVKDNRFSPITHDEVAKLECGVSLLTHFEKGQDYLDWEIGVHGIQIHFNVRGVEKTATYLPEVAREQGWTKEVTIDSLIRKAGYRDRVSPELRASLRLSRYQSEKCIVTYDEYCRLRRRHRPY